MAQMIQKKEPPCVECLKCGKRWEINTLVCPDPDCGNNLVTNGKKIEEKRTSVPWKLIAAAAAAIVAVFIVVKTIPGLIPGRQDPSLLMEDVFNLETEDGKYDYESAMKYPVFGSSDYKRSEITSVSFQSSISNEPENSWDVSAAGDGSIKAWVNEETDGLRLTIASKGKMLFPADLEGMFEGYTSLKSLEWNDAVDMQNVKNMRTMFYFCEDLEELDFSPFHNAKPTSLRAMLCGCDALGSSSGTVNVSSLDTSAVEDMTSVFKGCDNLKTLDLSKMDTSSAQKMRSMFQNCTGLESITFGELFTTEGVNNLSYMFRGCENLTGLDISTIDTKDAEDTSYMFYGCKALHDLNINGLDLSKAENTSSMFKGCSGLESLTFTSPLHLGDSMFADCTQLKEISFEKDVLSTGRDIFKNCTLTVHYPAPPEGSSWTDVQGNGYGGSVTWVRADGGDPSAEVINIPDPVLKKAIQDQLAIGDRDITYADAANMPSEFEYDGKDKEDSEKIHDLTGIEAFTTLTSLRLNHNRIDDLTPVSGLTGLEELLAGGNTISDIQAVAGLTDLVTLNIGNNPIQDISVISQLTGLTWLNLENLSLKDTQLEAVKGLTNLQSLYIGDNQIQSLSSLEALIDLQVLKAQNSWDENDNYVGHNQISDLTPLSGMRNLQTLDLRGNRISDISALGDLRNIKELNLNANRIQDISPIGKMQKIEILCIGETGISDLTPLKNMITITKLYVYSNGIEDLSPLENMTGLTILSAFNNRITSIEPLEKMTQLQELYLTKNRLRDISGLKKMTGLKIISIKENNDIEDYSVLDELPDSVTVYR